MWQSRSIKSGHRMWTQGPSEATAPHWPLDPLITSKEVSSHRKTSTKPDISKGAGVPPTSTTAGRGRKRKEILPSCIWFEPGAPYISWSITSVNMFQFLLDKVGKTKTRFLLPQSKMKTKSLLWHNAFFIKLISELFWLCNLILSWKYKKCEFWGEEIIAEGG